MSAGEGLKCQLGMLRDLVGDREVIVVGHRAPDTDAVISSLTFAYLASSVGIKCKACRVGSFQPETRVVLEKVGLPPPEPIDDVRVRARDVMRGGDASVAVGDPVKAAVDLMVSKSLTAVPIVGEGSRVQGVFTIESFARYFIRELASMRLRLDSVPLRNFLKVSGSKVVVGSPEACLDGRVYVGAWGKGSEEARAEEIKGQILVVGDREDVQVWALRAGVSALIVTGGHEVKPAVRELAKASNVIVAVSPYDTYTTLRLLDLSQPVERFAEDPLTVHESALLTEVKQEMVRAGVRVAIVVDELGRLKGIIGRAELVGEAGKPVALVDHNEFSQSVDGVEEAQVVAVVDHHRVGGDVETIFPILFRVEPLGSTNTILWRMAKECGVSIPARLAEAMLYAILSDTLLLRSPTTTPLDREAVKELAGLAGVSLDEAVNFMRIAMAANEPSDPKDIVTRDLKIFNVKGVRFGIAQVLTTRPENYLIIYNRILETMAKAAQEKGLRFLALMITDGIDNKTYLMAVGDREPIEKALKIDLTNKPYAELAGVTSRKSQVLPRILKHLR